MERCFRNAGQIYYGDVIAGKACDGEGEWLRHGHGLQIVTATTVTGDTVVWGRYKGAFRYDKITGVGVYRWSDGGIYKGDFLDGKPHGTGTLKWPEGSSYDGSWVDGEMSGQGSFHCIYTGVTSNGTFYRNCLRQHDGSWLDVRKQREHHRSHQLHIGALRTDAELLLPVSRCSPACAVAHVASILSEPPFLVPLVLADTSCSSKGAQRRHEEQPCFRDRSAAPLCFLEEGDYGCHADTTVHLAFAAAEMARKRDCPQMFRDAIQQALLTFRLFALVFGAEVCGDLDERLPAAWSLDRFFHPFSLPPDLFDQRHFRSSGYAERFLPPDRCGNIASRQPASAVGVSKDPVPGTADDIGEEREAAAHLTMVPPPVLFLLQFVLVSLRTISADLDDDAIRAHVSRRFSEHVPLHRISIVVVSDPEGPDV